MTNRIKDLMEESYINAKNHGFWEPPIPETGTKLMLVVSELVEAFEEVRSGRPVSEMWYGVGGKPEGVPAELADVVIRIFDFCQAYKIDLETAIQQKMEYNRSRPYKHNKVF